MIRRLAGFFFLVVVFLAVLHFPASAQDTVLTQHFTGSLDSVHSAIMNQTRQVQVFLPSRYKQGSGEKYDVLYVLDGGNWNTGQMLRTERFIEDDEQMPPTIIVSVMGIDRNVELTPTHLDLWQAPTGGADKFLGYIKNELIPYVNQKYPSNGHNAIYGHSLGGMFVVYAMLNEPSAFQSYIAVDPSMWWDKGLVARMAAAKLPSLKSAGMSLYVSGREGPEFHGMQVDTLETVLKQWAPENLHWKVVAYPNETHASVRFKTMYDGLKFTYGGYGKHIDFMPVSGSVLKDKPYTVFYYGDTSRTFYTTDGSIPTLHSKPVTRLLTLTGPATLTYKLMGNRSDYDQSYSGKFTEGAAPVPLTKTNALQPGGFRYAYYDSAGTGWPDPKKARPSKTGLTTSQFDTTLSKQTSYLLVVDGFVEAKEEGYYGFFLRGETGSKMLLNDKPLMALDSANKDKGSYLVYLTKGYYKFHVENRDRKEQFNTLLYWITPESTKVADAIPIPADAQYSLLKK